MDKINLLWFVVGIVVGVYPAYLYGRIVGVKWAYNKAKEIFKEAGIILDGF